MKKVQDQVLAKPQGKTVVKPQIESTKQSKPVLVANFEAVPKKEGQANQTSFDQPLTDTSGTAAPRSSLLLLQVPSEEELLEMNFKISTNDRLKLKDYFHAGITLAEMSTKLARKETLDQ